MGCPSSLAGFLLLTAVATFPPPRDAETASDTAVAVVLSPPQAGKEGKLEIRLPKKQLLEEIKKSIPESVDLPDEKLGNQLIYREVQLNRVRASGLKPHSMLFDEKCLRIAGEVKVTGDVNALYEHIVVTTEVRTIAKIFGREIKTSVPVIHRDWRPKGTTPFTIDVEIRATCTFLFPTAERLEEQRLALETVADYVRIKDVQVTTEDPLLKLLKEVIATVGESFPNEGFNKPIKASLTRRVELHPFAALQEDERRKLKTFRMEEITVNMEGEMITVSAVLQLREPGDVQR